MTHLLAPHEAAVFADDTSAMSHDGYGLIKAAVDDNPGTAIGLDGTLSKLSHNSGGPLLLGVVAAGLIGFALHSIAGARYRKV